MPSIDAPLPDRCTVVRSTWCCAAALGRPRHPGARPSRRSSSAEHAARLRERIVAAGAQANDLVHHIMCTLPATASGGTE
jgi:hypothetical protein